MRKIIDRPLNALGRVIARRGYSANAVTLAGAAIGLAAAIAIAFSFFTLGLILILLSRLADGLDGAVARATQKTDFGGYLDIAADFFFYGAIPFAFVLAHPAENAIAGAFLLLSFYTNGTSFLGYAIIAEKANMETSAQGSKSLYYSNGLLEGTETIVFLLLLCAFPMFFAPMAWAFGAACFLTAFLRIYGAYKMFDRLQSKETT